MKKIIILALTALMMVGCDIPIDGLNVVNGTKYVVKSKRSNRKDYGYIYRLVKVEDSWYDYGYKDTANFDVGDTVVITIRRISN